MSSCSKIIAAVAVLATSVAAQESGPMTYYTPGLGACGVTSTSNDAVVALNTADYDNGAHCFQWITIDGNGAQTAAQVVDLCPGCGAGGIDVSPAIFDDIAPLSEGVVEVTWYFQ
ncbi:RlpA-like double-psi beta-barrel-protein domain-containing protein-containing protein [Xylariaceae sp. FL0255]|nr:RlpA-like double-psi beta-barrel-protein domain-containing protein-containing protein [Xylariaceae sp. FL0255]